MSVVVYHSELTVEELWERLDKEAWTWEERRDHWDEYGYFYHKLSRDNVRIAAYAEESAPAVDVAMSPEEGGTELSVSGHVPAIYGGTVLLCVLGILFGFVGGAVVGVICLPLFLIPTILVIRKTGTFECPNQDLLEVIQLHLLTR